MRVLITRPEREATALATALGQRGHVAVIAPLFRLDVLHPPNNFAAALSACQAVLLTSANGARALAEASEQRSKPVFAVGDTTAATAEGLGFTSVWSAAGDSAALSELVRQRLDPKAGPLLHVSGVDVAGEIAADLSRGGFEVRRFALYEAREAEALPDSARAALQARALDAATFFSPRAATLFARLVTAAGLAEACRPVTAIAISPAAAQPLAGLPFRSVVPAARPTRQAVLDEIDRLPLPGVQEPGVQEPHVMSDTPASPPPPPVQIRRGLGYFGAFVTGLITAALVLAGAVASLPYWPEEARLLWRGPPIVPPAPAPKPVLDTAALEAAKKELTARLDDLDKRVRAAAATAAHADDRPQTPDPAITELRGRIDGLEGKLNAAPAPAPAPAPTAPAAEVDLTPLKTEIASLHSTLQSLDGALAGQKDAIEKLKQAATASDTGEQKAVAAARASAVIGIAARLNAALDAGQPFTAELDLLAPLRQGDGKLGELSAALRPAAQSGVASRATLAAEFPAMAKAALAEDRADDSFGERLLGKVKGVVSLRRVGADVQGESAEAKLARAEAALAAGDLAKAIELVKSLPPQVQRATSAWLARAEARLAAQKAVDQIAAHAVSLLGAAR
jgi:uroporphyrinogen-III synthase